MALGKNTRHAPKRVAEMRDYWRIYRRNAILLSLLTQLLVTLVVGGALIVASAHIDALPFIVTMGATIITSVALNIYLMLFLLAPLRDLATAIARAAGQTVDQPLGNPNLPRYAKDGFHDMLLYIYKNNSADNADTDNSHASQRYKTLLTALNQTNTGIVVMNTAGEISFANRAAPVKQTKEGALKLELLFDEPDDFTNWLAACETNTVHAQQTWLRVPNKIIGDEDRRIFNVTASFEQGSAAEVVLIAYDESDIYQPEDDGLDFISFAAHELRGPITVIRGYLDVLSLELEDVLTAEQKELFQRLIVSGNRLSGYINNILNTSKYDRRHLKIHLSEESLAHIYQTIRDDMNLRASSQHRQLVVDIPDNLPTVAADPSSISEVLSNLIDNGIKYSNNGGIVRVNAAVEGAFVKVSVVDNGIGMPASVVGNLFHKFYRSHRSRETVAGTGIGLYICKAIVESHGGTISVSSTEGVGSTFSFTLPVYASVAETLQANGHINTALVARHGESITNHATYSG